jgi:hypothetical protein
MARGDNPTVIREKETPPEGIAAPDKVLMCHPSPNIGYRWVPVALREKKEKWGFEFVRDFIPGDELGKDIRIEDLTPEQLREKADALAKLAENKANAAPQELKPAEKEHLAAKQKKDAEIAAMQDRAAKRGHKK